MRVDEASVYSMPLIMGPLFDRVGRPGRIYGRVETLSATFRTEPDAVRPLVPDCFQIPGEPTVTVSFGDYDHVDFMAGGGYRVAYAGVSARFEGEESVEGLHVLIMWENETLPIIMGRELIGIPKLHADITPIRTVSEGGLRATASVWGHEVMRIDAEGFKDQNMVVRRTAQKRANDTPWLSYKHIPSFNDPVDVAYPMVVWNEVELAELAFADSSHISFGDPEESDIAEFALIPQALDTLPLGDLVVAIHAKGSATLALDRSHRLQ